MIEIQKPKEIEKRSFAIIDDEAGAHGFSDKEWPIVRRMIHSSADFEYLKTVRFHEKAIESGLNAIRSGCRIITDTHMAKSGIRKTDLEPHGGEVVCFMGDKKLKEEARKNGTTLALTAVNAAITLIDGGIYVVGNAPTALMRLAELIQDGRIKPALVIGLPVGFVNTVESKEWIMNTECPYITNIGRKGGSNIAASVVNALLIMA